jgi:hypothetical protein
VEKKARKKTRSPRELVTDAEDPARRWTCMVLNPW